jgi:NAD/NADP transhydrogenase beta subunit
MLIAIEATLLTINVITIPEIAVCILIGSVFGMYYANKVAMTKIPEMVALLTQVDIDQHIPAELYLAVAELLAWLYGLEHSDTK